MGTDKQAVDRLPSLPQLLLRIVEAVHDENQGLPDLAAIIRHDVGVSARLLAAANSSFFNNRSQPCHTLERALLVLGLENVKTLVVTAALQQFVGALAREQQAFLKVFWRRSLIAANFGQVLAGLTSYRNPAEAYLAGLLREVGQLIHLNNRGEAWLALWQQAADASELAALERQHFSTDHCEKGAGLVGQWPATGFLADAIRYSLEPVETVQDAHHLVKITNLAAALAAGTADDEACQRAYALFGLGDALTEELCRRIAGDVGRLAESMQIDIAHDAMASDSAARAALGSRLSELNQLGQLSAELARARSLDSLEQSVRRVLNMTLDCRPTILFTVDRAGHTLVAHLPASVATGGERDQPAFEIPLQPGRSEVTDALLDRVPRTIAANAKAVVDRQLLSLETSPDLLCLPLLHDEQPVGVLVLGRARNAVADIARTPLVSALCRELSTALAHQRRSNGGASAAEAPARDWVAEVSEAIHEAGNPLSIVRNYLEVLRSRLGEGHAVQDELNLIRDEIDRVGTILLRLRGDEREEASETVALDAVISDVGRLFEQSLFAAHRVTLQRRANAAGQIALQPVELKQILVNLLKNAVEAMPNGGQVEIESSGPVMVQKRAYTSVIVRDNGPGIPPELLDRLFEPVVSTKGGAGLGLSVVRRLVEGMGGVVKCRSDSGGTTFELLLPWQDPSAGAPT